MHIKTVYIGVLVDFEHVVFVGTRNNAQHSAVFEKVSLNCYQELNTVNLKCSQKMQDMKFS
jgi:hypothetical protein